MKVPPAHSIAAELLDTEFARPDLIGTKSLLTEIRDMADKLSEFESCTSDLSESDSSSDHASLEIDGTGGFMSMNEKKRNKKFKRRLKLTPNKEEFLKKPNLSKSQ